MFWRVVACPTLPLLKTNTRTRLECLQADGKTYADLCTTELDGVTCNQPNRGITRFWGNSFDTYEVSHGRN